MNITIHRTTLVGLILALIQCGQTALALTVTRGPYLQQGTPQSVIVCWRTDTASGSAVRFGTSAVALTNFVSDGAALTNHAITISNLQPATKYYYEVGSLTTWFSGDTNDFFITAPPVGQPKSTRVWILGDSGEPGPEAASVRDAYAAYTGSRPTDVWLMLGDNAYDGGKDSEYQSAVFNFYPSFLQNTVLWPTIGNHDRDPAYFSIFNLPQNGQAGGVPSGTEKYYSFDYANVHFVCLDSYSSDRGTNGPMMQWLRTDLAATTQDWLIAYWHHPPYSMGTHDSDTETELVQMRMNFVPVLESFGVDLVLAGHSHDYQRSFLLDGHYGLSTTLTASMKKNPGSGRTNATGAYVKLTGAGNQGAVYTVAGCGAMSSDPDPMPAMFLSLDAVGSVVLDVNSNRLDFLFLKGDRTAGDYFTMIKTNPPPALPPTGPSNLVALAIATNRIDLSWSDTSAIEESFHVERSTDGTNFTPIATLGANATNLTDLGVAPDTAYLYRVLARNAVGDSAYSDVAQATTPPIPPPPPDTLAPAAVTNLFAIAMNSNTVSLYWTVPGNDGHTGTAAFYDVRLGAEAIVETNWDFALPIPGAPAPAPAGNVQAFTVTGLAAGAAHWFALKAGDETNNLSPVSNSAMARTPVPDAPATPTDLVAVAVATNEVDLSWIDNSDNEDSFKVERSIDGVDFVPLGMVTANITNAADLDAAPNTTYFYRVRACNAAGDSPPSNVAQATTPPIIPPDTMAPATVTNLRVSVVATNSLTLAWTATGDDGNAGTAAAYELRFSLTPITESNWLGATLITGLPAPAPAGTNETLVVTGLGGGTTYYFALKTADEQGNVSALSSLAFATTRGLPSPWRNMDIGSVAVRGSAAHTNGVFTVLGAGSDIGSSADSFHYAFQPATGNCEIIARITTISNTSSSAKAGVMIRESTNRNARFAMMTLSPDKKIRWLRRTSSGGDVSTTTASGSNWLPPQWLRVTRTNNIFNGYRSTNGVQWTLIGTRSISMGTNALIGLGVTSRSSSRLNTSRFDNVTATP